MSNEVSWLHNKRHKKEASSSLLLSLPDEVALTCLSRLSRLDCAALFLVSKGHRSLVVSPEEFYYVCLTILPNQTPRWFILRRGGKTLDNAAAKKSVNWCLRPIPSHPCQPLESSSFVVLDNGIYIIGGIINGNPTSEVLLLDCLSHTWRHIPSMRVARACAAANVVDGKIYVFGGCEEVFDSAYWAEVFDPKTQAWDSLPIPKCPEIRHNTKMIDKSVVIEDKVYVVDEENQCFYYLPSEGIWGIGHRDSKRGNRKDWCAIGKMLYCRGTQGTILWCEAENLERCEAEELEWRKVQRLDGVYWCKYAVAAKRPALKLHAWKLHMSQQGFSRMSINSRGNIVVFWKIYIPGWGKLNIPSTKKLELWCAEISMERRPGGKIWGKIEWADAVSELDPLS